MRHATEPCAAVAAVVVVSFCFALERDLGVDYAINETVFIAPPSIHAVALHNPALSEHPEVRRHITLADTQRSRGLIHRQEKPSVNVRLG